MFYLHTKFCVLRSNDSLVIAIQCTDNMCCYFIFYRTNCLNESFIFFEDLLPHKFSGCYISAPVVALVSHFANFHGHHTGINDDRKLVNTKIWTMSSGGNLMSSFIRGQMHGCMDVI